MDSDVALGMFLGFGFASMIAASLIYAIRQDAKYKRADAVRDLEKNVVALQEENEVLDGQVNDLRKVREASLVRIDALEKSVMDTEKQLLSERNKHSQIVANPNIVSTFVEADDLVIGVKPSTSRIKAKELTQFKKDLKEGRV